MRHGGGPMTARRVVILGGGPAGVGAAFALAARAGFEVVLVEQREAFGGNSGSFEHAGMRLDYGSHRLHHATDPAILAEIGALLGDDLLRRPRRGRIRLRGRWVRFPLAATDLLLRLDRPFALRAARDMVTRRGAAPGEESFASVLRQRLGPTISEQFYFPYARKLWGAEPEALSAIQARKRVSAISFAKLARKILRPAGGGTFYYPRRGFGQISEAYGEAARARGARILLGARVDRLVRPLAAGAPWQVEVDRDGRRESLPADHLLSTLPLSLLARLAEPAPPAAVVEAAAAIRFRSMVLAYLELDVDRFSTTDAHYFPEESVRSTRISEPKNYSGVAEPAGRTVLCAELPCDFDDATWRLDDAALGELVAADLARVGLPLPRPPVAVFSRRLRHAYPVYFRGYEAPLATLEEWIDDLPAITSYGRQGAFAHDNTHHALFMARCAVDCLTPTGFDRARWDGYREIFATHVVED